MRSVVPTLTLEAQMLLEADMWLIERVFERFSHWWQKTISYKQDCFWWALAVFVSCVPIFIVAGFIEQLYSPKDIDFPGGVFIFLTFIVIICIPILYSIIKDIKLSTYNDLSSGCSNVFKTIEPHRFFRGVYSGIVVFLFISVFIGLGARPFLHSVNFLLGTLAVLLVVSTMYFVSCDPLPPSNEKSRLQKWTVSLREKMSPVLSPVPVPAS